jgi:hypothetical protein
MRHSISQALHLLGMLERKSNFKTGRVWYGRAVTYADIAKWFEVGRPSERTLRRWMAELRKCGLVVVRRELMNQGMRITITAGRTVQIPVQKPMEKLRKPEGVTGQTWPLSAAKFGRRDKALQRSNNKKTASAPAPALPRSAGRPTAKAGTAKAKAGYGRKLDEFYALKRVLAEMPLGHPRWLELHGKAHALEDEIGRTMRSAAPLLADTG